MNSARSSRHEQVPPPSSQREGSPVSGVGRDADAFREGGADAYVLAPAVSPYIDCMDIISS